MSIELKIPTLPESVADAAIAKWHKQPGDVVQAGENIVDIETDKVVLEVPAPHAGVLTDIVEEVGATVVADQLIGHIDESVDVPQEQPVESETHKKNIETGGENASPSVRKLMHQNDVHAEDVHGSGKHGKILKQDVEKALTHQTKAPPAALSESREQQRVPMSRMRARIAERLVAAQHEAAMLTTFNEVNMQPVMDLRTQHKDQFEKTHGVRLGFMSFFVKAVVHALKKFPTINASIEGGDLVYHGFYDVGVAVNSERGLVVPVLRNADLMPMHEIETRIRDFAQRAQNGELGIDELNGGTFTVTNGGVFGSMLSTPIINPPQSAILGMHKIQDRPMAENGQVVIRPIMYLALSYDHRIVDGAGAVQFLVSIKETLEDPARLLLDI